jgi:hypothetical protein
MGNELSGDISKEDLIEIKKKQLLLEQENKKIKLKLKKQEQEQSISREKTKSSREKTKEIEKPEKQKENPKELSETILTPSSRKEKIKLPKDFIVQKKQTIPVQLNQSTVQIDPYTIFS